MSSFKEFAVDYFRTKYNIEGNFEVVVDDPWEPLTLRIEDNKQHFVYKLRESEEITFDGLCLEYVYRRIKKAASRKSMFNMLRQIEPSEIDARYNFSRIVKGPKGTVRTLMFLSQVHFKGLASTKLIKECMSIWYEGAEKRSLNDI